jgi:hypothetical protein
MSVLLLLANRKCTVIASDGIASKDDVVLSLDYNKTFEMESQKLFGGVAGLLDIDGSPIINEIENMIGTDMPFSKIKPKIIRDLTSKLNMLDEIKHPIIERKVDVVIISKKEKKQGIQNNSYCRFEPKGKMIVGSIKNVNIRTLVCGEDKAKDAILPTLDELEKNNKIESYNSKTLIEEAKRIIKIGIDAGMPKTGGGPFYRAYP